MELKTEMIREKEAYTSEETCSSNKAQTQDFTKWPSGTAAYMPSKIQHIVKTPKKWMDSEVWLTPVKQDRFAIQDSLSFFFFFYTDNAAACYCYL